MVTVIRNMGLLASVNLSVSFWSAIFIDVDVDVAQPERKSANTITEVDASRFFIGNVLGLMML